MDLEENREQFDYKVKYELSQLKVNSLLIYTEMLENENKQLKYDNVRLRSHLFSTTSSLAEKERMFLLLKTMYNNK